MKAMPHKWLHLTDKKAPTWGQPLAKTNRVSEGYYFLDSSDILNVLQVNIVEDSL